ncbi:hypothetical protein, partial [Helicobacter cetorum]|uniref:hypothetical protein n=1 Tax=Helicobacter cetorum TaxID=138563 RepID=UPI000CF13B5D
MVVNIFKKILHKLKLWYYLPSNVEIIKNNLNKLEQALKHDNMQIKRKLSMQDNVWRNDNVLFYVPNYPLDLIQSHIVDTATYFEMEVLDELKGFLT